MVRNKNQEPASRQYNFFSGISFLGLRANEKLHTFYIPLYHTITGCLSSDLPDDKFRENQSKFGMVGITITAIDKEHALEAAEGIEKKCSHCKDGIYTITGE